MIAVNLDLCQGWLLCLAYKIKINIIMWIFIFYIKIYQIIQNVFIHILALSINVFDHVTWEHICVDHS